MIANISLTEIITWSAAAGGAVLGLKVIFNFVCRISRLISDVETYGPVLLNIAEQFRKNGGNSLKDQLDRVEVMATDAAKVSREAHQVSQKNHESIVRIEERTRTLAPANSIPVTLAPTV